MPKSKVVKQTPEDKQQGRSLKARGFDDSYWVRRTEDGEGGYWRARCSQCQAAVINGIACHETGCLNARS